MDVTDEARISLEAPAKRRSFAVSVAVLTMALVLLAALLVWRVSAPKLEAPPGPRGAVGTVGIEDLPVIGDHRSEGLPGTDPVPGTTGGHPSTGPHPPQKHPKQG